MAVASARIRHGISVREAMAGAAAELIARQGYSGSPVDQLASQAGVTRNQLFHHFGSKEGLALAAVEHARAQLQSEVLIPAAAFADGAQRAAFVLRRLDELRASSARATPLDLLAALAAEHSGLPRRLAAEASALVEDLLKALRDAVKSSRSGPRGEGPRAREVALLLVACLLGRALLGSMGLASNAASSALLAEVLGAE